MKKIISAVCTAAVAAAMISVPSAISTTALADTSSWNDDNIMPLLNALGIMQGDGYGDYGLDRYVSREEMAKIAVNSSAYKDETAVGIRVSPFSDVNGSRWSAAYIMNGTNNGLFNGYLDGSFHPDDTVNYEEAVTMMLRVLGYSDSYFGVSYPYGQVNYAKNIDLLDNVEGDYGSMMTRRQIARMVYNALDIEIGTTTSSGSTTVSGNTNSSANSSTTSSSTTSSTTSTSVKSYAGSKLISIFDASFNEDVIIKATPNEDNTLGTGKVNTSLGKYNMYDGFDYGYVGLRGDMVVKNDKDILCFVPDGTLSEKTYNVDAVVGSDLELDGTIIDIGDNTTVYYKSNSYTYSSIISKASKGDTFKVFYDTNGAIEHCILVPAVSANIDTNAMDKYVIYSVLNNSVIGYKNGTMTEIDLKDTTTCYKGTTAYSYSNVKNEMEMGDVLKVKYKTDGDVDYIIYESGNMEGPIKVVSSATLSQFSTNSETQVMRDGNKSNTSAIAANDIVYYSADLNMILAYSAKVTGIYQSASPSRDNPTSVTISGKTYEVEGVQAYNDLSSSGTFKYGDTITICLGRDGETAAGVVTSAASASSSQAGYVIDSGKKDFSNNDGTTYSSYYVDIAATDGNSYEYAVNASADNYIGAVIKVNFSTSGSSISSVSSSSSSVYGDVDASAMTIGTDKVDDDCAILDVVQRISTSNAIPAYKRVYIQRLDGMTLKTSNVLYYHKNSSGKIDELILNDATGDMYKYGMTTSSVSANQTTKTYKFDIDGSVYTVSGSASYGGATAGSPYKLKLFEGSVTPVIALKRYSSTVQQLTQSYALINNKEYKLSDEVVVYEDKGLLSYNKISLNDAINGSYTYSAYYDKTEAEGGRIRIIIAAVK